jgi:hypothetical protein
VPTVRPGWVKGSLSLLEPREQMFPIVLVDWREGRGGDAIGGSGDGNVGFAVGASLQE